MNWSEFNYDKNEKKSESYKKIFNVIIALLLIKK